MSIKTVPQPPYSPDLVPCDFWLFPKLRGCRYETIEEMKETVTKVIDMLIQEDFHGAFQKLLERYNKCIAAGGELLWRRLEFHVCTINKSAHTKKKPGNLFNDPRMPVWIYWVLLWTSEMELGVEGPRRLSRCLSMMSQHGSSEKWTVGLKTCFGGCWDCCIRPKIISTKWLSEYHLDLWTWLNLLMVADVSAHRQIANGEQTT